ncbi:MAG: EthD domain-containing protein [Verrucomicrobiota bacterium JB023]|nr:EthD domain-containing protein [Verrucomicrobiota bacterium JB023]
MIKFVYCVRKKEGMSDEDFFKYWKENHGPLVRSVAKTLKARRYVQSHLIDTAVNDIGRQFRGTKEAYDGITEVWWDSVEVLNDALQTPEGKEANKLLIEDEARFCELADCSVFLTEEHEIFDYRDEA